MALFETSPVRRRPDRRAGVLIATAIAALAWSVWNAADSPNATPPSPWLDADEPRISASARLIRPRFAATRALTDFGLDVGARYVKVRILASVEIVVDIRADRDVVLAGDASLCLIGPFAQPDYAGLAEPCWGEPDLGATLQRQLPLDGSSRAILPGGVTVALRADMSRDPDRCDYPPGDWRLEIELSRPTGDGVSALDVPVIALELPATTIGPLPLLEPTNYCGLANVAYVQQGEPLVVPGEVGSVSP
jgi:hypothetical protein